MDIKIPKKVRRKASPMPHWKSCPLRCKETLIMSVGLRKDEVSVEARSRAGVEVHCSA